MATESLFESLPSRWEITTLGSACSRGDGGIQTGPFGTQLHAADYIPSGIPMVMPKNIREEGLVTTGIDYISDEDAKRLSRYLVRAGDILYSRRGEVDRRVIIDQRSEGWLCGTDCLRIRFGGTDISPSYAYYYLGHPSVREWLRRHATGAIMPGTNTAILSEVPFVVPPIREQRAIAHILGTLDDKIELNRRMNATLEEMARALFRSWFVDFDPVHAKAEGRQPAGMDAATAALFPDSFMETDLGGVPLGWRVSALGAVTSYVSRGIGPTYVDVGGIRVLNQKCIRNGRVMFDAARRHCGAKSISEDRVLQHGDVLVNSTGVGTLGRVGQIEYLDETSIVDSHITIVRAAANALTTNVLGLSLLMRDSDIASLGEGSTGQTELSRERVKALTFLVPPLEIQSAFDSQTVALRQLMCVNERQARQLASVRDALLPKLLSGEIRVHEAERQLEAVL